MKAVLSVIAYTVFCKPSPPTFAISSSWSSQLTPPKCAQRNALASRTRWSCPAQIAPMPTHASAACPNQASSREAMHTDTARPRVTRKTTQHAKPMGAPSLPAKVGRGGDNNHSHLNKQRKQTWHNAKHTNKIILFFCKPKHCPVPFRRPKNDYGWFSHVS